LVPAPAVQFGRGVGRVDLVDVNRDGRLDLIE
jgi:hypothetical protein